MKHSPPALRLEYRTWAGWLVLSIVLSSVVLGLAMLLPMPLWSKITMVLIVVLNALIQWRAHRIEKIPRLVLLSADDQWQLVIQGLEPEAAILTSKHIGALVLILEFTIADGKVAPLVLHPFNCDDETRRLLRVRLSRLKRNASLQDIGV